MFIELIETLEPQFIPVVLSPSSWDYCTEDLDTINTLALELITYDSISID